MHFTDIPYEVLTGSLLPLLDIPDVLNLGATCLELRRVSLDQHYWRQLTLTTFRLPPQPIRQKGWHELYCRLSTAKVFSWGFNEFGRLGHSYEAARSTQLPLYHRTPTEIETLRNEVVVDLRCGGWSTWALTSKGKVYGWGKLEGDSFRGETMKRPRLLDFGEPIDRIAVGRRCCFALAESGNLHVVDVDFSASAAVKLSFSDDVQEYPSKEHPTRHFAVGWHYAAAVIEGLGLVAWKSDVPEAQRQDATIKERSCRARRIIRTEELNEAASNTDLEIIGLMVGDGYLVYLTEAGTVHRVALDDEGFEARDSPTSFLLKNFHTTPKLSYLSGSFLHFGLFNTAGQVLIGNVTSKADEPPIVMSDLQNRGVIGLSWGDWHSLALCEDGSILSWGKELRSNGCLGLGYQDHADARSMGLLIGQNEVVSTVPRRIPGFGGMEDKFAFCVAAAGWHSAALVADFKVPEQRRRHW